MRFQTTGVRIGASSSLELPIQCDEPSELHVAWHVTDGASLDFVADFIHLNGETVLNESTSAALDVALELYGEGGCCLTWANRHVFQPRTLSYTVTLTANRARREASEAAVAEQRTERERREESTRELTEQVAQLTLAQHAAQALRAKATAQLAEVEEARSEVEGARAELEEARERLAALEAALVTSSAAADAAEGVAGG